MISVILRWDKCGVITLIFKDGEISLKQKQDLIGIAASNDWKESESLRGGKAFED